MSSDNNEPQEVFIPLQPGESLQEALNRRMAEMGISIDDVANPATKPAAKKKAPKVTVADPMAGDTAPEDIPAVYGAFHIYREHVDQTEGQIRTSATHERTMFGPKVLVYCHLHFYGEPCTPGCRERVYDASKDQSIERFTN